MTITQQHTELVRRLIKPGDQILSSLTENSVRLIHSAMGIAGEMFELFHALDVDDSDNFLEESGDVYFYMQDIYDLVSWNGVTDQRFDTVEESCALVVDTIKKHTIYNRDLDDSMCRDIVTGLDFIDAWIQEKLEAFGFNKNDALYHNIQKLNKRYSSGTYSDQQAKERADKNG